MIDQNKRNMKILAEAIRITESAGAIGALDLVFSSHAGAQERGNHPEALADVQAFEFVERLLIEVIEKNMPTPAMEARVLARHLA